ncbi:MAG: PD-(D/E)XK nuclease family protein [Saprospiraceae bacterium]|nr:PD-(D/E)XK nuclease family protein [Saprospiraceae bacterium]
MLLHLSHDFDSIVHAPPISPREGEYFLGPSKLLLWLEGQLGLSGYRNNTAYLRIELYRQALGQHLAEYSQSTPSFFERSFAADRFATAESMLSWRDELLLAGWKFTHSDSLPSRLQDLAAVEILFQKKLQDPELGIQAAGFADRFAQVLEALKLRSIPIEKILLYESEHLQTPVIQRAMALFRQQQIRIDAVEIRGGAASNTRLGKVQKGAGSGTGQLAILRARRDSDAATFLAQTLRENPDYQPTFLIPEMNLLLEQNLVNEGFAPMGVLSASLARPSLQVLKLAPAFLWEPVDVFKIMEFVTLPVKPLDPALALEIARVLAEKPGLFSDTWFAAVFRYLEKAEVPDEARKQYDFWFDRRRYPADGTAPKRDAVALYGYLQEWAQDFYEASGSNNSSLLVLAEQARRIRELLETLPEQRIGFLELERIVRTIYEPSPMQLAPAEVGSFAYAHQPGAFACPVQDLVWWNCVFENNTPAPDKWQKEERKFLEYQGVNLETPRLQSQRKQLLQIRPILQASGSLLLVIPEQVDGAEAVPPLLLSDIEAIYGEEIKDFTYCLEQENDRARFAEWLKIPGRESISARTAARPRPQFQISNPGLLTESEYETPTNLDSLFYYPHRWFFRQKLRLYRSSLLSVTGDNTLLGSLAHRFFEKLLKEDLRALNRGAMNEWVENEASSLLPREGATLLLYGREPERMAFLNKVKNAAWSLVSLLRNNGWVVENTEMELQGNFVGMPVRGKADLVLRRDQEQAIIDLKWSGAKRRRELIQNGEDLQLVLYAHLLPPPEQWPHTAYFILDEGKMVARNASAFQEAVVAGRGGDDHIAACTAILEKMERTYAWRLAQIKKGQIELRTARTAPELEALYEGQLYELLEMKNEDARWDDYRTLLG